MKSPRRRKKVLAGDLKVKRAPEEDDPDQDHPDGNPNAGRDPQTDNGDQSLERDLLNGATEVDRGPGLILSEEASVQDPGELDQGLL